MSGRFMFNPFSNRQPLRKFGRLQETTNGFQYEGLPYVGPALDYKDDDPEEFQPQLKHNGCVAVFDLSKTEDMDQYRALIQKICDRGAVLSVEERAYDATTKNWRVLVRWFEPFYQAPDAALLARREASKMPVRLAPETDVKNRTPRDVAFAGIDKSAILAFLNEEEDKEDELEVEELDKALV